MKHKSFVISVLGVLMICFMLIFASLVLASEEGIRYHLSGQELQTVESIAKAHLGENVVLSESFLYHDFSDQPFVYALTFRDKDSNKVVGSLYVTVKNLILIEVVKAEALHKYPFRNVRNWLSKILGPIKKVELLRVYYFPTMYPILRVKVLYTEGNEQVVIIDPEFKKIITEEALRELAEVFKKIRIHWEKAIPESYIPEGDRITKQLPVHEVNIRGTWVGCVPAAAANVLGYWDDKGCNFLLNGNSVTAPKKDIDRLLNTLKNGMHTFYIFGQWATWPWNVAPGIEYTIDEYNFIGNVNGHIFPSFFTIVTEIDNDRPCILMGAFKRGTIWYQHAVCTIGYEYTNNDYMVIIHDGWSTTPDQPFKVRWPRSWPWEVPLFFYQVEVTNCNFDLTFDAAGVQGETSVKLNGTAIGNLLLNNDVPGYLTNTFEFSSELLKEGVNEIYTRASYSPYDDIYDDIQLTNFLLKAANGEIIFEDGGTYHIGDQTIADIWEAYEEGNWMDPNPPGFWTELIGSSLTLTFEYPATSTRAKAKGGILKRFYYRPGAQCQ